MVAALCATQALAQTTPSAADIDAFVGVVEAAGCVIHDKNDPEMVKAIEAVGLTSEVSHAVVDQLLADGRAVIENGELRLKTGTCT